MGLSRTRFSMSCEEGETLAPTIIAHAYLISNTRKHDIY